MTFSRPRSVPAPRFSRTEIISKAEELTKEFYRTFYEPSLDSRWIGISFDVVFENLIYPKYQIELIETEDLGFDELGEKIWGKFLPEENIAFIDYALRRELRHPMRTFTCWHEVGGHAILQGEWLRQILARNHRREVVTTESMMSKTTIDVLERQANLFASHAAAPDWLLAQAILDIFNPHSPVHYTGPGRYTFVVYGRTLSNDVDSFDDLCRVIAYYIRHRFGGLSVEALSYRVAQTSFVRGMKPKPLEMRRTARAPAIAFSSPWASQGVVSSIG